MELIDLKSLNLTIEESRDIIKFLAQKRGISTEKLLSTIKPNLKRKNNKNLTTKTQQERIKSKQELRKSQQELIKSKQELRKSQQELIKSKQELRTPIKPTKTQQKPIKPVKTNKNTIKTQQTLSNTKKRIEAIRKKFNELHHNFPKSELKEIRKHLYNIENKNELETTKKYLDELDKKILKLNKYEDFIGIENIRDLFSILNYEPILVKTGFDNNYLEYRSEGNNSLSFEEYLNLIRPYLEDLVNAKKDKGEWKLQLTAQINFISLRPGSNEMCVMHTRSLCEEFMSGSETEEIVEKPFRSLLQRYQDN